MACTVRCGSKKGAVIRLNEAIRHRALSRDKGSPCDKIALSRRIMLQKLIKVQRILLHFDTIIPKKLLCSAFMAKDTSERLA